MDEKRIKEAKENFAEYLRKGQVRKEKTPLALKMCLQNSDVSFRTAEKLSGMEDEDYKPYL